MTLEEKRAKMREAIEFAKSLTNALSQAAESPTDLDFAFRNATVKSLHTYVGYAIADVRGEEFPVW